jgi:gamma-glutamyltranspeptidase/glutathione hydrolase
MVACPHGLASEAAAEIFAAGGNAVDAAIAGVAAIAVVYPHMNGVGGDNFWLMFDGAAKRLVALNGAGRAARAATLADYRARHGEVMPTRGGRAALTVPGAVSGWWEAHQYSRTRLGSPLSWATLLAAACRHARDGFAVSPGQIRVTGAAADLFGEQASADVRRTLWPTYHPDRLAAGTIVQPALARTLDAIRTHGADEFYRGALARRLTEAAAELGSPLAFEDLASHAASWTTPIEIGYREGRAVSFPPPTQGFAALAILGLLDGFDVAGLREVDYIHTVVEATKLAFADRDRHLADPDFQPVPVDECLDPVFLAAKRTRIAPETALAFGGTPVGGDTIALVTADGDGNAVSVIQSLYHEFGAGIVAGSTGVMLQNRGAFFSLDPRHPNCLEPGKRPGHTLTPAMYLVDGRPRLVSGTMGGEGQPQTQATLITRLTDRGYDPQSAVEAPRWLLGRTWGDASRALRLESRFDPAIPETLARRGHDVRVVDPWSDLMGHAQVIRIAGAELEGASDPRADGEARGV